MQYFFSNFLKYFFRKKYIKKIGNLLFSLNTIFAVKELNFCVRDGNRCILFAIVTNLLLEKLFSENMIMCNLHL